MSQDPSVFTRIIQGELPGRFVWRDDRVVAFLTIAPINPGHVLVVPIEQVDKWTDLHDAIWAHATIVAHHIGQAVDAVTDNARVALIVAGLEVPHCHIHLVPIDTEADLSFERADPNASAESLDEAAERIREALRAAGHGDLVPDA